MRPRSILLTAGLCVIGFSATAAGEGSGLPAMPFQPGERFTYDISWLGISAGKAVMEVTGDVGPGERPVANFVTTTQSSPMITKFYPVDNRVESQVELATFLPRHMTFRRREGKKKNDFEYTFRHQEGRVTAVKDGTSEELQIPQDAQDLISCLYFVRKSLALMPGTSMAMNVHHDKKNYKLEVRVEAIETVGGPWGRAETARVLVVMPFQGIFLNEGNIRVWFTTDDRHIPIRMKAKVVIGSIVADLIAGFSGKTVSAPSPALSLPG